MSDTANPQVRKLPIDPRIRDRRIAVTRAEGRKRLRILIGMVVSACVVGGAIAAAHSALLDVDHVDGAGAQHTDRAQIVQAAGLDRHRYLVDVHSGTISARLRALPWVASAKVARHWPGTVKITITERAPLAKVAAAGGAVALVDGTGRVLTVVPADQGGSGILSLDGLPPAPEAGASLDGDGQAALAVATALPPQVRPRIASIHAAPGDIVLRLTGAAGTTVQMGSDDQLDAKVVALTTMLAKLDLKGAKAIDLRVPSAPVLTRN